MEERTLDLSTVDVFYQMLEKYSDPLHSYQHTDRFNPSTNKDLLKEARGILENPTYESVNSLIHKLSSMIDQYAIDTGNPEETSESLRVLRDDLFRN